MDTSLRGSSSTASWTTGDVGRWLGVSAPTVVRAAVAAGIEPSRTPGGHRRFSGEQAGRLASTLGKVPVVHVLTRTEVRVLAALAKRPFGLRSARAVARAAGLSPTAAGHALDRLRSRRFVIAERRTVAEGIAKEVTVWRLRIGAQWMSVASAVSRSVLPAVGRHRIHPRRVPRRFWHLFWNATPTELSIPDDAVYIAQRMVLGADLSARAWAFANLPSQALAHVASLRGVDDRDRALIVNLLAAVA